MPTIEKYPIPDSRLPFVNAEFARIERNGKACLVTSVWGGEDNGRIYLIDPQTGQSEMRRLPEREPGAYMLQTGPDGRLYLGSGWGNLYRYDPRTDQFQTLVKGEMNGIVWGGCVTQRHVVFSANPGHACVYDWREERLLHVLKPIDHERPEALYAHRVIECPDGKILLGMNSPQARIILLDPASGERRSITPKELTGTVWTRDATFFDSETVALFNPAELLFFRYPSFEFIKKVPPPSGVEHMGGRACFCGKRFYALAEDTLWRLNKGQNGWEHVRQNFVETHGVLWPLNDRTICAVNVSGVFSRLNVETGELFTHELDANGPVGSHALVPVPQIKKAFGAPFINQRFWQIDLSSGQGADLGRASVGGGQINGMLWDDATRRVLLASYTTCTITAFDPQQPAHWPDNPKVLARVLEDQMRPKSFIHDGRYAWMASSAEYGHLGGALSRIDPRDGSLRVWRNLVREQTPNRVVADPEKKRVYVSTEIYADCQSAPPSQKTARLVSFNTEKLSIDKELAPIENCPELLVLARLGSGRVLVKAQGKLFSWAPENGAFDELGSAPEKLTQVIEAPDGTLYTSANNSVGRLLVSAHGVQFEPLAAGNSHYFAIADGKLWYIAEHELRVLAL